MRHKLKLLSLLLFFITTSLWKDSHVINFYYVESIRSRVENQKKKKKKE